MGSLHEECGVFGVWSPVKRDVAADVYYGLYALQHRGQESCGIVVNDDGLFSSHKDLGLVSEVFDASTLAALPQGTMAIGHDRYGTTGGSSRANCQPVEVNHCKGKLALAHNGNISNAYALRSAIELSGGIFHMTADTEVIAYTITRARLKAASIEGAISQAMNELEGAYCLVLMSSAKLIAVRDPQGFRPLCYGKCEDGSFVVASESCALAAVGAEFVRDVLPGEILVFGEDGISSYRDHVGEKAHTPCIFEYIYFARPDSTIDGVNVHHSRQLAGRALAKAHPVEADVVIGVPDSGLDAAIGYAVESGIPYGMGFVRNKYIGRTFISPGSSARGNQVRIKLSPIREEIEGKRVVLIDDSIVRGTTSARIVKLLREAGAREVHLRISSPAFRYPCYYGTDIDSQENLIACKYTVEETAQYVGADSLGYLPMEELKNLIGSPHYCSACFDGAYPTPVDSSIRKDRFEEPLSASSKHREKRKCKQELAKAMGSAERIFASVAEKDALKQERRSR